jgi:hypothetical protein
MVDVRVRAHVAAVNATQGKTRTLRKDLTMSKSDAEWDELEKKIAEKEKQGFKPMIVFVKEEQIPYFLKLLSAYTDQLDGLDKESDSLVDFYTNDDEGSLN